MATKNFSWSSAFSILLCTQNIKNSQKNGKIWINKVSVWY